MILIIDHGNGYMSLYAHNDTPAARRRRAVQARRRGGHGRHLRRAGRPALYFELRRNGQPVDPAAWLQRR